MFECARQYIARLLAHFATQPLRPLPPLCVPIITVKLRHGHSWQHVFHGLSQLTNNTQPSQHLPTHPTPTTPCLSINTPFGP